MFKSPHYQMSVKVMKMISQVGLYAKLTTLCHSSPTSRRLRSFNWRKVSDMLWHLVFAFQITVHLQICMKFQEWTHYGIFNTRRLPTPHLGGCSAFHIMSITQQPFGTPLYLIPRMTAKWRSWSLRLRPYPLFAYPHTGLKWNVFEDSLAKQSFRRNVPLPWAVPTIQPSYKMHATSSQSQFYECVKLIRSSLQLRSSTHPSC